MAIPYRLFRVGLVSPGTGDRLGIPTAVSKKTRKKDKTESNGIWVYGSHVKALVIVYDFFFKHSNILNNILCQILKYVPSANCTMVASEETFCY